jgi:uncharacterized repeat protein (TIGR01451 family)
LGTNIGNYPATVNATAPDVCFSKLPTGAGSGIVYVLDPDIILLNKTASATKVAPQSTLEYTLEFNNKDTYSVTLTSVVDNMDSGFTYVSMTSGPLPSNVNGTQVTWNNIVLKPGVTKWIMKVRSGTLYKTYYNDLSVTTNEFPVTPRLNMAPVQVAPAFDLQKSTTSGDFMKGATIPYTITLFNYTSVNYTQIRITDTLPSGFKYVRMRSGLAPTSLGPNSTRPVWIIPAVNKNTMYRLSFDVQILPTAPNGMQLNKVDGFSASGSIPSPIFDAPITVTVGGNYIYLPIARK